MSELLQPLDPSNLSDVPPPSHHQGDQASHAAGAQQQQAGAQQQELPEFQPLIGQQVRIPYPMDSLPPLMRDAAQEVLAYVKCPPEMVVAALYALLAVAAQGQWKVRINDVYVTMLALYFFILAESGERKSTVEKLVFSSLRDWVRDVQRLIKPQLDEYAAKEKSWHAKMKGVGGAIKSKAQAEQWDDVEKLEEKLRALVESKPKAPVRPVMELENATQEGLVKHLTESYPSAILLTAEGGTFTGGAGMEKGSKVGSFATYNKLYGGEPFSDTRSGKGHTQVQDVALSLSVSVQPDVFDEFQRSTKGLGRGSGFYARCLLMYPESTQGERPYSEPPSMPVLEKFHTCIRLILDRQASCISEGGRLRQTLITLSEPAKKQWVRYFDSVEHELRKGEVSEFVRDVVGKNSENAARIAGLNQVLEASAEGGDLSNVQEVSKDNMKRACKLAHWHLQESRRYFMGSELPEQYVQAIELSERIRSYCVRKKLNNPVDRSDKEPFNQISQRNMQRHCPVPGVKSIKDLPPIIGELFASGHLIGTEKGKGGKVIYVVHPKLLEGVSHEK